MCTGFIKTNVYRVLGNLVHNISTPSYYAEIYYYLSPLIKLIMSILQSEINDQSGKGSLDYKKSVTFVTLGSDPRPYFPESLTKNQK